VFILIFSTVPLTFGQPSKSEYFTLKTEVLSEVTNKLMPDDILLKAGSYMIIPPVQLPDIHDSI